MAIQAEKNESAVPCWVTYLDIYGFRATVKAFEANNDVGVLHKSLALVESDLNKKKRTAVTFKISDSFFYVHEVRDLDVKGALDECMYDIRCAIDVYIHHDFALRGGVAFGPVAWGPSFLVGDAVARAVEYEKLAGSPMVIVPGRELVKAGVAQFARDIVDLEAEGGGIFSAMIVTPRRPTQLRKFAEKKYKRLRFEGPPRAALQWKQLYALLGGKK
jgi:hypothetical protein